MEIVKVEGEAKKDIGLDVKEKIVKQALLKSWKYSKKSLKEILERFAIGINKEMEERTQQKIKGNGRVFHKGMLTSLRQDWQTPQELYDGLDKEFKFDFDPCPAKPKFDGLEVDWGKSNFVNPPYGRYKEGKYKGKSGQDLFIKKAIEEHKKGKLVVLLIPVRTSSMRWQTWILDNPDAEIRFMPKRFKFSKASTPAMFCSAIVIFWPEGKNDER